MKLLQLTAKNYRSLRDADIKYACAQWHLEAWFFGDAEHLRDYLGGKALGNVGGLYT